MKKFLHVGCGPMDKTGLKGFSNAIGAKRAWAFDVWMLAAKQELPDAQLHELAQAFLP